MMATNTPKFNSDIYLPIASNHLVVYSIYSLHNDGDEITSEDIISACFTSFPKKFSLKKYPQWPDAAMISRRWIECQSKGYIAAKTDFGFKLTAIGTKIAEKVAKTLGVAVRPSRTKKIISAPVVEAPKVAEKVVPLAPVAKVEKQKRIAPAKKIISAPVVEAPKVAEKTIPLAPVAKVEKQKRIAPAKKIISAPVVEAPKVAEKVIPLAPVVKVEKQKRIAPAKKIISAPVVEAPKVAEKVTPLAPVAKVEHAKQKRTAPAKKIIPAPVVETPKVAEKIIPPATVAKAEKPKRTAPAKKIVSAPVVETPKVAEKVAPPEPGAKVEKPKQTAPAKKIIPVPVVEVPKVKQESKPNVTISQEAKVRAGKFVRMMETSDAYRHYKKSGAKSNIGEFDFRSLLLCTMESSPETLAKNVELFKGYAEIHNRQDLIVFLTFCKEKFSYLFAPQKKVKRKK
jgi:hypothetical protein